LIHWTVCLVNSTAKRYKKIENVTVVIWKILMLAERKFRKLDAPEKLMEVYPGFASGELRREMVIKREEMLVCA